MLKNVLQISLFALLCFVALESSYRVYVHGPVALNPMAMSGMSTIVYSDHVQAADNQEVWFELKPNLNVWHMGARLRTNSAGLADDEYAVNKPAGVFRIAVVGSSWTMASGVNLEDTWHAILEQRLNADAGGPRIEVINFAVEQYGISEIVGTLRHKVPRYQPDLVIVAMTITTSLFAAPGDMAFEPAPVDTLFDSYILRAAGLRAAAKRRGPELRPMIERDLEQWRSKVMIGLRDMYAAAAAFDAQIALARMGGGARYLRLTSRSLNAPMWAGARAFSSLNTRSAALTITPTPKPTC